ncbi:NlpC/P60 family protein [Luteipulveratus mongoliensis]|nr:NlpC/P60 family protein [Luteipulveratus mongoliensis]
MNRTIARRTAVIALGASLAGGGALAVASQSDAAPGKVHTASSSLTVRSGPSASAKAVGSLKKGAKVDIKCQMYGSTVKGTYGTSNVWDRIGTGRYVSDAYIYTGSDGFVAPKCGGGNTPPPTSNVHGRNNGPAGPKSGSRSQKVERVVNAALSQTGKGLSYSWGAGGKGGPSYGISSPSPSGYHDYNRFGFDCSGLTLYSYWKGIGKDIGPATSYQYNSGTKVSINKRQRGDLIMWGSSGGGSTYHVALYLGNNKIVEASSPRSSKSVHVRSWSPNESGVMSSVVRIIK